jgi:predicted DNA-binding protein with PD1-like motif
VYIVPKPDSTFKNGYGDPVDVSGPIEFTSGTGVVCHDEKGEMLTHLHAVFNDSKPSNHGGHLLKGKNPILATMELLIIEIKGVDITRRSDEETQLPTDLEFKGVRP